jgi:hypothetical protein
LLTTRKGDFIVFKRLPILAAAMLLVASAAVADKPQTSALSVPIGGNFIDAGGGAGKFIGTFKITSFAAENGKLVAQGFLTGTLTDSTGMAIGSVFKSISLPATVTSGGAVHAAAIGSCPVLHLDLGPLNLDLLGLQVNLSEVVLDIVAQSGAGNLLGNLLCAVTNLLNGGPLAGLVDLLNQILGILGGVLG